MPASEDPLYTFRDRRSASLCKTGHTGQGRRDTGAHNAPSAGKAIKRLLIRKDNQVRSDFSPAMWRVSASGVAHLPVQFIHILPAVINRSSPVSEGRPQPWQTSDRPAAHQSSCRCLSALFRATVSLGTHPGWMADGRWTGGPSGRAAARLLGKPPSPFPARRLNLIHLTLEGVADRIAGPQNILICRPRTLWRGRVGAMVSLSSG